MRRIALAAVFAGLMSPLAHAASDAPKQPSNPPMASAASGRTATATPAGAENCGTPDEFKPCPPLPRRNLPTYPANKR